LDWLRRLIAEHGDWNRKRLAQELCRQWGWRNGQGVWKDFAARSFLLKHYLGLHVGGENVRYLAQAAQGRDLACVLFGAAAWKCEPRDRHLSITEAQRQAGLQMVANNTRFLVLPWVRVPGLASHVLGQVVRRIAADWQAKYGHGLHWLETFVARGRFAGTCFRAANWECVGQTTGRSCADRNHTRQVPVRNPRWRPMQLQTSVGEVNVQVQWGKSAALHRWVCPAREQWGLAAYQTVSPELQELACFTATKTRSYQARENEGAPMGSGAVASLCRQLQNRFKSCGQFWSRQGLTHLLAINVLFKNQSARFLWN